MSNKKILLFMSATILLMLAACSQETPVDSTAIAEQVMTGVAQTIEAMPSSTSEPTATETPTTTITPTETLTETATETANPSLSPTSSSTASVAATQTNICDNAIFVSDITIPDGTEMVTGTTFTKTWQVRNTGTCTWDTDYAIVFVNGDRMEGKSPTQLERTVAPGETIDISLSLVAPSDEETYLGYWQIRNASKETFGQMYYVQIIVFEGTATVTPTSTATPTETATEETSS